MGGFMGIGNSSAKTDRGVQLAGQKGLWNVFNWALPQGQGQEAQGAAGLNQAQGFWSRLMKAGRSDIASMSAPATNAILEGADASRRAAGEFGTGRTGGGTAAAREAGTTTQKNVADVINQNLWGARTEGAKGVERTGVEQLQNAGNLLGLGTNAVENIMTNATSSREISAKLNQLAWTQAGQLVGAILGLPMGGGDGGGGGFAPTWDITPGAGAGPGYTPPGPGE